MTCFSVKQLPLGDLLVQWLTNFDIQSSKMTSGY